VDQPIKKPPSAAARDGPTL